MTLTVPLMPDLAVVPVFKYVTYEDLPESEKAGHAVHKTEVVVQVQYSGNNGRSYSPVFPAHAVSHREGHRSVTYAERWAKQYEEFMAGNAQHSQGTPLENLRPYGVTEAQLSMCRALRVYSIEALLQLDGGTGKSLGMFSNDLMGMARKWVESRNGGDAADEIQKLREEIERLKATSVAPVSAEPEQLDVEIEALKQVLRDRGVTWRGSPSLETFRRMVEESKHLKGK